MVESAALAKSWAMLEKASPATDLAAPCRVDTQSSGVASVQGNVYVSFQLPTSTVPYPRCQRAEPT